MLYNTNKLWYAEEGIRGYSKNLLNYLEQESQEGRGVWSEFAAPTVCKEIMVGCTAVVFDPISISPLFSWSDNEANGPIRISDLNKLVHSGADNGRWRNAWVHKVIDDESQEMQDFHNEMRIPIFHLQHISIIILLILLCWSMRACSKGKKGNFLQKNAFQMQIVSE